MDKQKRSHQRSHYKSAKLRETVYAFTALFERNDDGSYTVTVPVLPGLVTEGKNLDDARRMAADAIRCYIASLRKAKEPVPKEGDLSQMRVTVTV